MTESCNRMRHGDFSEFITSVGEGICLGTGW